MQSSDKAQFTVCHGVEAPVLDWSVALYRSSGDDELLAEIINLFREDGPQRLEAIRDAVTRKDAPNVELHAHSLKGSLGYLGAAPAAAAAQCLESLAALGDLSNVATPLQDLEEAIGDLIAALGDHPTLSSR